MKTLIDIKELSKRLSIATGTLYNWCSGARRGLGPFADKNVVTKLGRARRFDVDAIEDLLSRSTIKVAGKG
jgi:transposase-like protein